MLRQVILAVLVVGAGWALIYWRSPIALPLQAGLLAFAVFYAYGPWAWRRRQTIRGLRSKPRSDLSKEFALVANRHGIDVADVERLWLALASFYRLEPDLLRADDRLLCELYGVVCNPHYDCFGYALYSNRSSARAIMREAEDWSSFLNSIHQVEKQTQQLATCTNRRDGRPVHQWRG